MALNAKDLRIGNWIKYIHSTPFQVSSGDICEIQHEGMGEITEAVLLTPEILEKCGFETNNEAPGSYIKDGAALYNDEIGYYHINDVFHRPIDYLHVLQNWWFANTGEDLIYTP